jgi:3-oxoacyl-[acyl-carrier protein] reductase
LLLFHRIIWDGIVYYTPGQHLQMSVALITGASGGMGKEIAIKLSAEGYSVIVNYLSSDAAATSLVRSLGNKSCAIRADVGDIDQVRLMCGEIKDNFGRLDVIINNAGITKDNLLIKQSEPGWDAVIRTNLKGCFNVIRTLSPLIIGAGGGHIINVSSYSGIKGKAGQAAYSASKAGILGMTLTAAKELSGYNIRVNAIVPGYMLTDMGGKAQKAAANAARDSILKRLSQPGEVAEFILFLIKTGDITGQVINLGSRVM